MSVTVSDLLTSLAYRFDEDSSPDIAAERLKRVKALNEGYRKACQANNYWFMNQVYSTRTVDGQEVYSLPTNFREIIECRVYDGSNVVRYPMADFQAFDNYNYPPIVLDFRFHYGNKFYFVWNSELHLLPAPTSPPVAVSVDTLTSSGTLATATVTAGHGYTDGDYIVMSGANETNYNGTYRINVSSTTVFTYTITATTSPATGTIVSTKNNLTVKYFCTPTNLSSDSDTILIPDLYSDCVVAFAWARLSQKDGLKGDAGDGFEEFNDIVAEMNRENMRRGIQGHAINPGTYISSRFP